MQEDIPDEPQVPQAEVEPERPEAGAQGAQQQTGPQVYVRQGRLSRTPTERLV